MFAAIGPGAAAEFAREYFPDLKRELRIASAYFSLTGYELGWKHIPRGIQLHLLVGVGEWGSEQAKRAVVAEVKHELRGCEEDPRALFDAVRDIVQRMEADEFTIRVARGIEAPFHCKAYICDADVIWHGSANYSRTGLRVNAEQVQLSRHSEHIQQWTEWYDSVAQDAHDLLEDVRAILEEWLRMASPFDAYLLALSLLLELRIQRLRSGGHEPVYYQQAIVATALRQIDRYRGALLVVATGLGKTVIGAEIAARLHAADVVDRVLLLAPKGVHVTWNQQLVTRGMPVERFANDILFGPPSLHPHHQVCQVQSWLDLAGPRSLIIVDEAHTYRNQLHSLGIKGRPSRVFERLCPAVERGARILLLTASPYSTNQDDLNSLLYLLPHRLPNQLIGREAWRASTQDEFVQLPPVTVFGLRHLISLARTRGDVDDEGRPFVVFTGERRYLPRMIEFHEVTFSLPLHGAVQKAFDQRCFNQRRLAPQRYLDEEGNEQTGASDTVFNSSLEAWLSSPVALKESIEKNLNTPGGKENHELPLGDQAATGTGHPVVVQVAMWIEKAAEGAKLARPGRQKKKGGFDTHLLLDESSRAQVLGPIATSLRRMGSISTLKDHKLSLLATILGQRCLNDGDKAVVFVNLLSTATYLRSALQREFHGRLRLISTVEATRHGPRLLPSRARGEVLKRFSPRSHDCEPREHFDVLICTDADGIGINLQDANTLVHYDLPTSADPLIQRLGRVLRLTADPSRMIHVYALVPAPINDIDDNEGQPGIQGNIDERLARMRRRDRRSQRVTGDARVEGEDELQIPRQGAVGVQDLLKQIDTLGDVNTSFATHLAVLESHRSAVEELRKRNTMHSARRYAGDKQLVIVVVRCRDRHHGIVFDPVEERVESDDSLEVLGRLQCEVDEPRAAISVREVVLAATKAVEVWCENTGVRVVEVERVCAVYLEPAGRAGDLDRLLTAEERAR